ncbi:MAG: hypothetical protein FWE29_05455 [Defluviitaleaceae bacterium]|nr:hypothetical protein [Defluviitaleaceae bacterium]
MALNNFNSFHNFNIAQQQRAGGTAKTATGSPPSEKPQNNQQNPHKGQVRQPIRSRNQAKGQAMSNRRQMQNPRQPTQRQQMQNPMLQHIPQMQQQANQMQNAMPHPQAHPRQNVMPTQQQSNQMQNTMHMQPQMQNQTQLPPQMPQMQQQVQSQPPQQPANGLTSEQQISQYMKGEVNGIPINEENINQLIKTLNENDAKKGQPQNPSYMSSSSQNGMKAPNPGMGSASGRQQNNLAPNSLERLAQHIQNEVNGTAFYSHLNRIAPTIAAKQNFEDISERCRQRADSFNKIYTDKSGKRFESKNVVINNQVSFKDGIQLALNEERKNITELFSFYEDISDIQTEKAINCQVFKKLIDLHVLMDMKNNS